MTPRQSALARAVVEIERHSASAGWDGPVRVFALVRTTEALATDPTLAQAIDTSALGASADDAEHLTAVEQEGLPAASSLEDLLAQLAWPDAVDGAALVVERIVLPPDAEATMPTGDEAAALAYLEGHPERQDVRIAVGVLRSGESWCALRTRSHDSDDAVGGAPDAVPGLVAALDATLR
ncbi:conserved hypothetical protein [Beutenbergia cavernae DSM 12333]|uniref:Uncharacterized protein n=1 Tax=Beutenbergia cavernae (strain ATCC BAA-8 / DSM 12333 / CCUG 43141 / JCM 11478 / NBRC 16432 / NCIMB 13614 / HKI 0122) TaxID=471853 RepID=C5BZ16_BEUC1|nr:PPA1309 family protein [Beutenbergia cavernae]ACQ81131.1 conserved hypothetical protein [Beutenbergia cavernae DSM 12333]